MIVVHIFVVDVDDFILVQARRSNRACRYLHSALPSRPCADALSRPFAIISILFSVLLYLSMQAVLEPCEGELGCVLWDDAVRPPIALA